LAKMASTTCGEMKKEGGSAWEEACCHSLVGKLMRKACCGDFCNSANVGLLNVKSPEEQWPSHMVAPSIEPMTQPPNKWLFVREKLLGSKFWCLVISNGFPHWLCPMDWSMIHWMQFDSSPMSLLPPLKTFLPTLWNALAPVSFEAFHFATLLCVWLWLLIRLGFQNCFHSSFSQSPCSLCWRDWQLSCTIPLIITNYCWW
jgi:hypothetical protein